MTKSPCNGKSTGKARWVPLNHIYDNSNSEFMNYYKPEEKTKVCKNPFAFGQGWVGG